MTTAGPETKREHGGNGEQGLPVPSSHFGDHWKLRHATLSLSDPVVMGILNLTPDSFSDGGAVDSLDDALRRAHDMVEEGAGLLDVGGESTRPDATPVPVEEELARVLPFVQAAAGSLPVPISVDTRNAEVARACLEAGAEVVNDVSGLAHDAALGSVVAEAQAGLVLMHMRGDPRTMRTLTDYEDVHEQVAGELRDAMDRAQAAGIPQDAVVVDPGIGFAKTAEQSLALLSDLGTIRALGRPILVGPSRKSFLGAVLGVPPRERLHGTVAACVVAYLQGARIFRVHDVAPVVQALAVARAIEGRHP